MANALEAASLVMIPSGYEDGVLGSLKPTDGSGDFTFSRGSNLSATRINEQGYIEKGYENLLYPSNDFSGWSKVELDITPNQADPFGGNTATLITTTGTTFGWIRRNPTTTGVQTISFYAKAGSNTIFTASVITAPYPQVKFTLTGDGTTSSNSVPIDSTITSIGDGWYRCSMTYNFTSTYEIRFYPNDTINETIGDSAYIYGFQLNQGLVAYPYIETTTAPVAGGILEDMPRLDWSGSCPSLLLEPSRTNLIGKSEYGFITANISIDYNNAISPEGYQNAFKSTATNTGSAFTRVGNFVYSAPTTISVFLKRGNTDWLNIISSGDGNLFFNFNTQTGEFGSNVGSLVSNLKSEDYGNGWWRVSALFNHTGIADVRIYIASSGTTGFANGTCSVGDYFYGYGYQAEDDGAGGGSSYPTSYIPTYGVSQTRLKDTANNAIANTSGQYWTLFIDYANFNNGGINGDSSMVFKDSSNATIFHLWGLSGGFVIRSYSGDSNGNFYGSQKFGNTAKAVIRYDGTEIGLFINGVKQTITSPSPLESNWNQLYKVDTLGASDNKYNFNQMLVFPTALSDSECIALTTI